MLPRLDDNHVFIIQYRICSAQQKNVNINMKQRKLQKISMICRKRFLSQNVKKKFMIFWHMYYTHQRIFKVNSFLYE